MTRILFWLALAFLVLMALRSKVKDIVQAAPSARPAATPAEAEAETMLCCAHCGVHYPASETVAAKGRDYCSAAHAGLA